MVTILLAGLVGTGVASFVAGHVAGSAQPVAVRSDRPDWLQEAPDAALTLEQQFLPQAQQLQQELRRQQNVLLGMLEDRRSTDDQISVQLSAVARCRENLIRAVGNHVVELREVLPGPQQRCLMQSCGQFLGQEIQRRYRWRGGAGQLGSQDRPRGNGRGGQGGPGMGRGQRYRGGRQGGGMQQGLQLTEDQLALSRQLDPVFDEDASRLTEQVAAAHVALVRIFEDPQASDSGLASAIDTLVAAHTAMEQRVAQHVLLLRPHLSSEQIRCLVGICRGTTQP